MPDWLNYLYAAERAQLDEIDTEMAHLASLRATLHNRAKQRRFRERRKQ